MNYFSDKCHINQFPCHRFLIQDQAFEYLKSRASLLAASILTPLPRKPPQTSPQSGVIGNPSVRQSFSQDRTITGSAQARDPAKGGADGAAT